MLKFWLWVETIVLYKDFSIFWNRATLPPLGPPERILPPQTWNSSFIARFWWNLKHNIFICSPIIFYIQIYDKGPPSPPFPQKTSISSFIGRFWWNLTFLRGGGIPFIINFYLNYYWWTYENVMFQISSKSGNKWRILLLGRQNSFWGSHGGQSGPIWKNRNILM